MTAYSGQCLCGAITAEMVGEPKWAGHCHCPSCRKATGAAFSTYVGFDITAVRFTGETPASHVSSPGVMRRFCRTCGSSVAFQGEAWPDEIHFHAGFLKDPNLIEPEGHAYVSTKVSWLHLGDDGLPQEDKFSG